VLQEWKAAVFVWSSLLPGSPRHTKVCWQLLELQTRLGPEVSLIAQEVADA
jgi:hypothetical protein